MTYDNLIFAGLLQSENITSHKEKLFIVDDVFSILESAYSSVRGGLAFKSKDELIVTTTLWRVIYLHESVVGVIIYKAKRGLKMVATGVASFLNKREAISVKNLLAFMFKYTFRNTWMEVSEGLEKFILKIGGEGFLVSNSYAAGLTGKNILSLDSDGYHYTREIKGVVKRKVIIGAVRGNKLHHYVD